MSLDAQFFRPFVIGTLETLKIQCHIESKPGKPFLKSKQRDVVFDIAGTIGLTSERFTGSVTLCFPENVFLAILSSMMGEKFEVLTDDLTDGAAELLNIIFGHAKRNLNDKGHDIQMSIPSVIRGNRMQTKTLSDDPVMVIPFETPSGVFYVEIASHQA